MKLSWPIAFVITAALAAGCVDDLSRERWGDILGGRGALGRWQTLGRSEADSPNDRDSITISRDAGRVRQLRLEVQSGAMELHEMVVTLDDGTAFRPNIGQRFDDRSPSPIIDLPRDSRGIQKVDFVYSPAQSGGKATVILLGR